MSRLVVFFLMVVAPAMSICLALLGLETLGLNAMGWFLLVLGIAYPAGGAIYYFIHHKPFWRSNRPGKTVREESGDQSFWFILPGFLSVFFRFAPRVDVFAWVDAASALDASRRSRINPVILGCGHLGSIPYPRPLLRTRGGDGGAPPGAERS